MDVPIFKIKKMKAPLETVSLDAMFDNHIGKRGSEKREIFESELKIELLGHAIKQARQERKLAEVPVLNLKSNQSEIVIRNS